MYSLSSRVWLLQVLTAWQQRGSSCRQALNLEVGPCNSPRGFRSSSNFEKPCYCFGLAAQKPLVIPLQKLYGNTDCNPCLCFSIGVIRWSREPTSKTVGSVFLSFEIVRSLLSDGQDTTDAQFGPARG